ncbi:MAG: AgmX/PglI C-terminal domain-containing protein, partial [Myxococcota bacterium]|nr:AgmX/PglI C-terminal domain-containing protein [Myxococcota bacterium]
HGYGIGAGIAPGLGGSSDGSARAKLGELIVLGALDQSLIVKVIKRQMAQLKYCYQKQLTSNSGLSGKVVIKFVISKDGEVSSAKVQSSTMNDSTVEQCITGRFMRFVFPEPKGGGIVIVKAPLTFESR